MREPASIRRGITSKTAMAALVVVVSAIAAATGSALDPAVPPKHGDDVSVAQHTTTRDPSPIRAILDAARGDDEGRASTHAERIEPDGTRIQDWFGQSLLRITGACVTNGHTCLGNVSTEYNHFFLNSAATGAHFTLSWRPADESLRTLRVNILGLTVEGESPIHIRFDGLPAGEHVINIQPASNVSGSLEQVVDWSAQIALSIPPPALEIYGATEFESVAGCILGTCGPLTSYNSSRLIIPWRAVGTLTLAWDDPDLPLQVSIPGTGFSSQGTSPLTLDISGITAGEWHVGVQPADLAPLSLGGKVGWIAHITQA